MRTILIPVSNGFFVRNGLRTDFLQVLKETPDLRVVFLAPAEKIAYYREQFSAPNLLFEEIPPVDHPTIEKFFKLLEAASIHTATTRSIQFYYFYRKGSQDRFPIRLASFILQRACALLGSFRAWRAFIRLAYASVPDQSCAELFQKYKPDLVFCPTLIYGNEYVLLRDALRRGVPTIGMTSSWDNLYSKTFLRVSPDLLFVQTPILKEQAALRADYPPDRVRIIGVPQYDPYFRKEGLLSREEFAERLGADPSKKILLYAFSGKVGMDIDFAMLDLLNDAMKKGELPSDLQVFVRPYPKRDFSPAKVEKIKKQYGFVVASASFQFGVGKDSWEFDASSLSLLSNSLFHSDIVVSTYSTFFIEAAIFDRPLIAVGFDADPGTDYWNSARRFFEWDHLADIKALGAVDIASSRADFLCAVHEAVAHPEARRAARAAIVGEQCAYTDGKSGERLADELLSSLLKSSHE
ncbi:MAG: CDP-glycerol glycerophosphotransferase family protein [Patescibacteria group bacterium]